MVVSEAPPVTEETGESYYVATTGDDGSLGTKEPPFRTLQQTIRLVKPGDTVLVRAGRCAGFKAQNFNGAAPPMKG